MDDILSRVENRGIQYRKVNAIEVREAGGESMIVEGHACTFDDTYELYRYGRYTLEESIDAHAFDDCDMSDVIMQYNHEGRVFARTRNNTLTISTDETGLKIRADLSGTEIGRQLYEEIRNGYTDRMSFGFTVAEDQVTWTEDHETGQETCHRTITKIGKLYDVSAVSIPANDDTDISARSFADGIFAEHEKEALEKRAKVEKLRAECLELLKENS